MINTGEPFIDIFSTHHVQYCTEKMIWQTENNRQGDSKIGKNHV